MEELNEVIDSYWPCLFSIILGYLFIIVTLGLSLCLPWYLKFYKVLHKRFGTNGQQIRGSRKREVQSFERESKYIKETYDIVGIIVYDRWNLSRFVVKVKAVCKWMKFDIKLYIISFDDFILFDSFIKPPKVLFLVFLFLPHDLLLVLD